MKACPRCRLGNPDSAERCDCGYDFTLQRPEEPVAPIRKIANTATLVVEVLGYLALCVTAHVHGRTGIPEGWRTVWLAVGLIGTGGMAYVMLSVARDWKGTIQEGNVPLLQLRAMVRLGSSERLTWVIIGIAGVVLLARLFVAMMVRQGV